MAFLDEFGKKFTQTSQSVAKKAKDVAEVSNLKLQIRDEERKLKGCFSELGEQYYALYSEDAPEELKKSIERVDDVKKKIALIEERIHKIENQRVCPECGMKLPENGQYCTSCGAKYPEKEDETEEAAVEYISCAKCGAQILTDALYCTKCGAKQDPKMKEVFPEECVDEVLDPDDIAWKGDAEEKDVKPEAEEETASDK